MWASTTDDNAVYEQSDKRMCQLINIRGTSAMPAAGRPLSTMRRPQGFLSGRLSGVGAKDPLWLPTGDQGRLVSEPLWLSAFP